MRRPALLLCLALASSLSAGTLERVASLHVPRLNPTATLLHDGRVLVVGGSNESTEMEIIDPATGSVSVTAAHTRVPLVGHTATLLDDGRVLIAGGGYTVNGRAHTTGSNDLQLYDPITDTIESLSMAYRRSSHAATLLSDGRVLITGGDVVAFDGIRHWTIYERSAEIFDPLTGASRVVPDMNLTRTGHSATRLADGRVLIAGGYAGTNFVLVEETFDPVTETFTTVGTCLCGPANTATRLLDGRVFIAGDRTQIFDPVTNAFSEAGEIGIRTNATATLLLDGRVLIAGGKDDAIVYDVASETIVERIPLGAELKYHAATRLPDGNVLLVSGARNYSPYHSNATTDVLRYTPAVRHRRRAVR